MAKKNESAGTQASIVAALKDYTSHESLDYERDTLAGRYRILVGQQLPELSSSFATAYSVTDNKAAANAKALYALVYQSHAPVRKKHIDVLKEFQHPNMVALIDSGIVEISTLAEARFVAVLERPTGKTIASIFAAGRNPISTSVIISLVLRPIVEILTKLNSLGISHNRINLNNVYLAENTVMLGECISEPSGYSQDFVFEPIERILAAPMAKSDFSISSDCYALAVLTLHMVLGFRPFTDAKKDTFTEEMLVRGSYHTLAIQWDFSSEMQDFFRGLLNDGRRERWDPESIGSWLSGRQFNLIAPSPPNEASRSFDFLEKSYYNRKAIANAIFRQWPQAYTVLSDNKLARWLETSAHKPEAGDIILRISGSISADNVNYERGNNDLIARIILTLDPTGPVRLKNMSVMIDGIGSALSAAFLAGKQDDIHTLMQILESDLPGYANEQLGNTGPDHANTLWKLQKVRGHMRLKGLGFGPERAIYDVHPELPCQSKLVKQYYATTLHDLMVALDNTAKQKAENTDFIDRHIAAFITSRLDINREVYANELTSVGKLSSHAGLIGLKLLVRAQNKISNIPLHGLCYWVVLQLLPVTDRIHKRSRRDEIKEKIMRAAETGLLSNVAGVLLSANSFVNDHKEFQGMEAVYATRKRSIFELKNNTLLSRHSRMAGRGIAQIISYGICLTVVYYTSRIYMHF